MKIFALQSEDFLYADPAWVSYLIQQSGPEDNWFITRPVLDISIAVTDGEIDHEAQN